MKNELIKEWENRVNEKINTLYDVFYIRRYYSSTPEKYGVMFNGYQTIIFFLDGGISK